MRIRRVGLIVLIAGALASCINERVAAPLSGPSFSVAGGGAKTYVVLGSGNALPADFASAVQSAGGTLTASLDAIGVAIATSSDASFAASLARVQGVQSVDEDVMLDFAPPRVGAMVENDASGEPGVGQASVAPWRPSGLSSGRRTRFTRRPRGMRAIRAQAPGSPSLTAGFGTLT